MDKLTKEEIETAVSTWNDDQVYKRIDLYSKYYHADNTAISKRVKDRHARGKTPNNSIPSAYYTTVVDTMAGYLFNNVVYKSTDNYIKYLYDVLEANRYETKDMRTGVQALAYNRAVELVYTDETATIKYDNLDPKTVIPIYTDNIDKQLFCALWVRGSKGKILVDVIYKDEWQFYVYVDGQIYAREEPRQLFFSECPVCIYNTQIIGVQPPFHQVIPYIDALDVLITGNSNEIERLVDALLVLGTSVSQDDLNHMDEWKALMDIKNEDRAEYLTKDMSPVFREYVSKLLIQEIHKHSHVVDWYNPDTGISGASSGKALLTRMFDMDMYSKRIEKIYKDGIGKRIKLIGELASISGVKPEPVYIEFKRTMLHDMEEKIIALNQASFLSAQTKIETAGFDYEIEKERIETESKKMLDVYGDIE